MALLARKFGTVTVCAGTPQDVSIWPDIRFVPIPSMGTQEKFLRRLRLGLGCFQQEIQRTIALWKTHLSNVQPDLILCHDIDLLPLACALKDAASPQARPAIIMDLREYYPRQFENSLSWRLTLGAFYEYLCREYLPLTDMTLTVSPGLKAEYGRVFGVNCQLVPSFALHRDFQPHPTGTPVRCIHHGVSNPSRKIEIMIEAMALLQGQYTLDLMLVPSSPRYYNKLRKLATGNEWVRFCEPVPMPEIVPYIARYDIGLFSLPPTNFNQLHFWPNKLFEFIQARLAVVVSPVPDMSALVRRHGIGVAAQGFSPADVAATLHTLMPQAIDDFKRAAHTVAPDLCWEKNEHILSGLMEGLLEKK